MTVLTLIRPFLFLTIQMTSITQIRVKNDLWSTIRKLIFDDYIVSKFYYNCDMLNFYNHFSNWNSFSNLVRYHIHWIYWSECSLIHDYNYENYRDIKLALRLAFHPDFHYVIIIRSLNTMRIFIIKTNNMHSRVFSPENVYRKYLESLAFWCFINYRSSASRYSLRAGSNYKDQGTRYTVKRVIVHPNYNSKTIDYDVALLQVCEKNYNKDIW